MTNFDYLKAEKKFSKFAEAAISAEKIVLLDSESSILACRRSMEFAVKWMYSVDTDLIIPYDDSLFVLMNERCFRDIVGQDLWKRLDFIRKKGNKVAHEGKKQGIEVAMLCLENLAIFLDFVSCCYADSYEEHFFDRKLIEDRKNNDDRTKKEIDAARKELELKQRELEKKQIDFKALLTENASLKEALSERRQKQHPEYVAKPLEHTELETRRLYIDSMLEEAGWTQGKDWLDEVIVHGMPNKSKNGSVDYILYDDRNVPLAIIEAKSTCKDVSEGRKQAMLYADILEKQYGRRPVIFLTNGFDTRIIDGKYPERKCASVYSKRDLEKWFNLLSERTSLKNYSADDNIAGRYYQKAAVRAVCDSFDNENKRKALVVMATGSGKTRMVIALCDILIKAGWVKNILFLADRNSLVTQAKRSFVNLVGDRLSCTNLVEEKDNYNAHCVFSTYQTMMNCIDDVNDEKGKIFTSGHFDIVICDEAHRSIYNKYKDIFTYFDALLVGLTATPKDEVDRNTYDVFELENGVPTYGYDLAQAVKDKYLVDYVTVDTKLKLLDKGIVYKDLSDEEKEQYENTFRDENGEIPDMINASELNSRIFNKDTIKKVLDILMTNGIKIDYGQKLGKTIIFAKNHEHAEKIFEVFNKEYPDLPGFAMVIDNYMSYAQSAIDDFSDANKLPQIAISVDMLDTGIDVPEILNLVFFKPVMSKAKFWQMIGRGTRLCEGLVDGEDKDKFYIFDFCGNFDFFDMNKGMESGVKLPIQSAIFNLQFNITYKLQDIEYQTERLKKYRDSLVSAMLDNVRKLDKRKFQVSQHLKYVEMYSDSESYKVITYEDTLNVKNEVAPLILPGSDDISAVRFDALVYSIELALLANKNYVSAKRDLVKKVRALAGISNIPEIDSQSEMIKKVTSSDFIDKAGVSDFEEIREKLRDLIKYIPKSRRDKYDTNFDEEVLSSEWKESKLDNDDLKKYMEKAEYYIKQHQDNIVIAKLKSNQPLTETDVEGLEKILWQEIGSKQDYENEIGDKPLGEFVRSITGLEMNVAKQAFAEFMDKLDSRQIYFVEQIVEYVVHNGMMTDLSVLKDSPFTDRGSVVDLFGDDISVFNGIKDAIKKINKNAIA